MVRSRADGKEFVGSITIKQKTNRIFLAAQPSVEEGQEKLRMERPSLNLGSIKYD